MRTRRPADIDDLHKQVTGAIFEAQRAKTPRDKRAAWRKVADIEARLAAALPVTDALGLIARRGAITAALAGNDKARAAEYARSFLADVTLPDGTRAVIERLLAKASKKRASRKTA